jgi:autotransporter adhesin
LSNTTALGNGATVSASNRVRIGNSSVSRIGGQVAWTNLSDGRIKENVQEAVPGLSFISELRPVTYKINTRKQDEITMQAMPDSIKEKRMLSDEEYLKSSSIVRTGFIAQEVEAAAKKVGFDFDGVSTPENETDLYGIRYAEFVVPLVKAVQEQQGMIDVQQATIDAQQTTLEQQRIDFQNQLQVLLERIEALENE